MAYREEGEGQIENLFARGRTKENSSESDKCESRSNSRRNEKVQYFHCKEYDHMKRDFPERAAKKKSSSPNIALTEEHEKYIGDVLIVSKCMNAFSHDE